MKIAILTEHEANHCGFVDYGDTVSVLDTEDFKIKKSVVESGMKGLHYRYSGGFIIYRCFPYTADILSGAIKYIKGKLYVGEVLINQIRYDYINNCVVQRECLGAGYMSLYTGYFFIVQDILVLKSYTTFDSEINHYFTSLFNLNGSLLCVYRDNGVKYFGSDVLASKFLALGV